MGDSVAQLEQLTPAQLAQIPGQTPPAGVVPNFENPATSATDFQIVVGIFLGLASISFLIRIYMKIFESKLWKVDDSTITLGFLAAVVQFVALIMGEKYGTIGRHYYEVHLDAAFSPWNYFCIVATQVLAYPALGLIKSTLLLQYWHIFSAVKWMRIGIYIGLAVCILFYVPCSIAVIVLSSPWNGESHIATLNSWHFYKAAVFVPAGGYIGVILDWYILLLPMPMIYQLQMPLRKKLGIVLIIMTGALACVSSILGVFYRAQYTTVYEDPTWKIMPIFIWSMLEMLCGVLAANMPSIHQLWVRKIKELSSQSKSSFGQRLRGAIGMHSSSPSDHGTNRKQMLKVASNPSMRHGVHLERLPRESDQFDGHSELTVTDLYHSERMDIENGERLKRADPAT